MNLFSKKTSKSTRNATNIFADLGHTPMVDWVAILLSTIIAIVVIAIFTSIHYMGAKSFIVGLPTQNTNTEAAQIKTKEEKMRDIIDIYTKKEKEHTGLLGTSQSIVSKDVVNKATSTASSTVSDKPAVVEKQNSNTIATSTLSN